MIAIPQALEGCRFIRVAPKDKNAIDSKWQSFNNYAYGDHHIIDHLNTGGNYGILPCSGVAILDIDNPAEAKELGILAYFAKTFTVKTGKGYHFYFRLIGDISPDKLALSHISKKNEKGQPLPLADLFLPGCKGYAVGPESQHQNGSIYKVVNDAPMMEITVNDLETHLLSKVHYRKKETQITKPASNRPLNAGSLSDSLNLRVIDLLPPVMGKGSTRSGVEEKGSHPVHGSQSGSNYSVNLQKNTWYCHRCQTGGGPLEAVAVKHGILSCDQVGHVEIKGDIFKQVKLALAEKEGYGKQIAELDAEHKKTKVAPPVKPTRPPVSPEKASEALKIIRSGKVLETFRETFKTLHSGDQEICDIITLSAAVGAATTSKGIQPGFSGHKGAGKTSGAIASLHLWPQEFVIAGGLSNKALFYRENLVPGSVVFSDDTYLLPDLLQSIKASMSSFQQGASHFSVDKLGGSLTGVEKKIPERTTFIFTSIDDSGDAEFADRQYKLSLNPDKYQKQGRVDFFLSRMEEGREELPVTPSVLLCRQILRTIKEHTFKVHIPYAKRLKFSNLDNMRDIEQFADFIQAVTILNYPNRNPVTDEDGITTLQATEEDFFTAMTIFRSADDTRQFRLTKNERALLDWLCENHRTDGMPESKIVSDFGGSHKIARTSCRRLLYGKDGQGGICDKVPGVFMQKETRPTEQDHDCKVAANIIFVNPALKTTLDCFGMFCVLTPEKGGDLVTDRVTRFEGSTHPNEIKAAKFAPICKTVQKNELDDVTPSTPNEQESPPMHRETATSPKESPVTYSEWMKYHQMAEDTLPDDYTLIIDKADRKGHVCHCKGCTEPQRSSPLYWNEKMPKYARTRICQPHHNEMKALWLQEHPEEQP